MTISFDGIYVHVHRELQPVRPSSVFVRSLFNDVVNKSDYIALDVAVVKV
jgi:hypothetical protein